MIADAATDLDLMRWYEAMGVDTIVGDLAVDRFAQGARTPSPPESGPVVAEMALGAPMPLSATPAAGPVASDLATLVETMRAHPAFAQVPLVPGAFVAGAALLVVGEAPGEDDASQGRLFSGAPGRLLDAMLASIGLSRTQVSLTTLVPWRPPSGRATSGDVAAGLPFLTHAVTLARPRIVLGLGETVGAALTGSRAGIFDQRGQWHQESSHRVMVTFGLDYLLAHPTHKRHAWADLRAIASAFTETAE